MNKRYLLSVFITALALAPVSGTTESRSSVNWITQTITATSSSKIEFSEDGMPVDGDAGITISLNSGRMSSYAKAREKAMDAIIQTLKRLRVDSENRISDLLKGNPATQMKLYDLINEKIQYNEFPVDFYTSGCRAVLQVQNVISALPFIYPNMDFPSRMDMPVATRYSSLIVDTRPARVRPMLFPVIYNEDGLEVYGRNYVDIRYAVRYGMVSYAYSESDAIEHGRAGEHPYITVAVKDLAGCPVLSDRDIKKIFSHPCTISELRQCKVIFIISSGRRAKKNR